jgi:CubicO group peptidase (beta-lactamase class C family)
VDYFPEYVPETGNGLLEKITLEHLLTMSSGFGEVYLMYADRRNGLGADDYLKYMMSRPVKVEPGTQYLYSSGDAILAGIMVEKAVGCSLQRYLYENLFSRIGISYPVWENDLAGHSCGASGLQLRLTEMMKLGVLYFNHGVMKGERFFDETWSEEATKERFDIRDAQDLWSGSYGYYWRILPDHKGYRASGVFGQETLVLPAENLIIGLQCGENTDFQKVQAIVNEEFLNDILK